MMNRPPLWHLLAVVLLTAALAGCSSQAPTAPKTGPPQAGEPAAKSGPGAAGTAAATKEPTAPALPSAASPAPPTTATQPAPAGAGSPTAQRAEPRGRIVYGWDTSVTPAWFDPQENAQLITP